MGESRRPHVQELSHEKAGKRVFLYNILQIKRKTTKAGWTPSLIEWDDASVRQQCCVPDDGAM